MLAEFALQDQRGDGIRLVICDDHPVVAQGLVRLLEIEAPDVKVLGVARSAEEAEALVANLGPDLVLMDIYLPYRSGIDVTRRICALFPEVKVVMFTVSDEAEDLYEALKAGAIGYITKDQETSDVVAILRNAHRGNCIFPSHFVERVVGDLGTSADGGLSQEEQEVLASVGRGDSYSEIAATLHLSPRTVRRRMESVYRRLHLLGREEAVAFARARAQRRPKKPR